MVNNFDIKDYHLYMNDRGITSTTLGKYEKFQNSYIEPTIMEERNLNVTQLSVFSRLFMERILFLGSPIDSDVANIITGQLMYLASVDDTTDITLYVNSPGGSVIDGLQIYDVMNYVKPSVSTTCLGLSASMGAVILSSGCKGKRYSLPHGKIMIHEPSTTIGRQGARSLAIEYEEMKKCEDTLYSILATNTGKDIEEIRTLCDRDKWYTAQEAANVKLIDHVIKSEK